MKQDNLRQSLIDGTIHVVAQNGLDKTTTKAISTITGINEVYIYRLFENKEELLVKSFDSLDERLLEKALLHTDIMSLNEMDYETRCRIYFFTMWRFLIGNRDEIFMYVRYYYSPYFIKYSVATHKNRFKPLVKKFEESFKDEADVWMILNHILNVMLDFAIMALNGEMPNEDNYTEHVFRVVYQSIKQYFRNDEER
ncbi:MAG: TetR/AcrR family transcriptional regulator [Ruminococcaceae bacterium]|nr:TetR/AcrR family transcriptional regulator [Oscillospiraceae bacterium]